MVYVLTPEGITRAYVDYLNLERLSQDIQDWDAGFLVENRVLELVERTGRGYVYGLFHPQTLADLLDYALPGGNLVGVVGILSRELTTARESLRRRNRQIRDLRLALKKG